MGMSTLTWTVTNSTQSVLSVSDERGVFDGVEVAVGESVSRIQLIGGPAQATVIDNRSRVLPRASPLRPRTRSRWRRVSLRRSLVVRWWRRLGWCVPPRSRR